ncbi:hypothetical protein J2X46_003145 [Nocardioides sp. BE266]|uniref:hypothetical protein n=1 Tax=Nocardioides sp. BE266 TaxID=2817725 RepID=UPI002855C32F|nr:hypothetical protein [Nocardioides sp. BE266]MDR7254152.1 hypothetical protein [Nocardioides sp. BE266]
MLTGVSSLDPSRAADVGVLLVHGIGRQRPGRSLVAVTDKVSAAFEKQGLQTSLIETRLRESKGASALMHVSEDPGSTVEPASFYVRFLEAHWADSFDPPGSTRVIGWVLLVAPLALLTRSLEGLSLAYSRWWHHPLHWWRIAAAMLSLAFLPIVAVALAVVTLALSLIRPIVPVEALRNFIGYAQMTAAQVLGDSYLYTVSRVGKSAIQTVVNDGLTELTNCNWVLVLAHSQGAQVAVDSLDATRHTPTSLITYGSGIGQLSWLRQYEGRRVIDFALGTAAWLGIAAVGVVSAVILRAAQNGNQAGAGWLVAFTMFGGYMALPGIVLHLVSFLQGQRRDRMRQEVRILPGVSNWVDITATADPVSGAPVVGLAYGGVQEVSVVNGNSFLTDHTSYLKNRSEVGMRICAEIAHLGGAPHAAARMRPSADWIQYRHAWGRRRVGMRIAWLGAFAITASSAWADSAANAARLATLLANVSLLPDFSNFGPQWSGRVVVTLLLAVPSSFLAIGALIVAIHVNGLWVRDAALNWDRSELVQDTARMTVIAGLLEMASICIALKFGVLLQGPFSSHTLIEVGRTIWLYLTPVSFAFLALSVVFGSERARRFTESHIWIVPLALTAVWTSATTLHLLGVLEGWLTFCIILPWWVLLVPVVHLVARGMAMGKYAYSAEVVPPPAVVTRLVGFASVFALASAYCVWIPRSSAEFQGVFSVLILFGLLFLWAFGWLWLVELMASRRLQVFTVVGWLLAWGVLFVFVGVRSYGAL